MWCCKKCHGPIGAWEVKEGQGASMPSGYPAGLLESREHLDYRFSSYKTIKYLIDQGMFGHWIPWMQKTTGVPCRAFIVQGTSKALDSLDKSR